MSAVRDALAILGGLTVAGAVLLAGWIVYAEVERRRNHRAHRDEKTAREIRKASPEGWTPADAAWRNWAFDHGLNDPAPREWER